MIERSYHRAMSHSPQWMGVSGYLSGRDLQIFLFKVHFLKIQIEIILQLVLQ